ncbi:MAG: hypothetical protein ACLFTQ_03075 [Candidatus Aenigmatarchaeota archaeon]
MKKILDFLRERKEDSLISAIVGGILLISMGVYLVGSEIVPFVGSRMIILGSGIFYVSVILLVFVLD